MSIKYIHIYKALRKNDGQLKAYREILVGVKNQFFRPETAFERRRKHIFMIKPYRKTALKSNERQGFCFAIRVEPWNVIYSISSLFSG